MNEQEKETPCPFSAAAWAPGVLNFETQRGREGTPIGDSKIVSEGALKSHIDVGRGGPPLDITHSVFEIPLSVIAGGDPEAFDGALQTPCGFTDADRVARSGTETRLLVRPCWTINTMGTFQDGAEEGRRSNEPVGYGSDTARRIRVGWDTA